MVRKGCVMSEESRKKMSESRKGMKLSDETKKKISKALKGCVGWNKGMKLGPRSKETKEKIGRANKGNIPWSYIDGKGKVRNRPRRQVNKIRKLVSHWVWCNQKENLPVVPNGCVIHHLDLNPRNNKPNNLLLLDIRTHNNVHNKINHIKRGTYGRRN